MRFVVTAALLLFAGFLAGGLALQAIVIWGDGDQEFIIAFVAFAAMFLLSSIVFLAVHVFRDVRSAANVAMLLLLVVIGVAALGLVLIDLLEDPNHGAIADSLPIIAGLTVPNAFAVIAQWAIVRWRGRPAPPAHLFGRGPVAPV